MARRPYSACRILLLIVAALVAVQTSAAAASAPEVSSRRLIEKAKFYDGRTVTYTGEVVDAIMRRGEYGWVNVYDGDDAIGVWCPAALLDRIRFVGNYKTRGDTVRIVGVFNRACQEHGGELDIHADTLTVSKSGHAVRRHVDGQRTRLIVILFLVTIVVAAVFRKRT